ncbi:recombinase family protein [Vibrio cholerae]|jgi:DNA invertase Pin-like site-specific DNA recombinase|uniref:recombinase family protein n=1 Tax=Vibrio cholerae TaxID=666 RepID=UPI000E685AB6|nr:recombinase family protein [Vibrio cholerae]EGR4329106.1 recombinase family protein [Vibrio cholerae]ELJ8571791.1 recombinase family protein [Vibrio cholerae]ELJ8572127.1 recombinase family protein [Vibrio cholerae]GIA08579.1 DNA invertase [Vibrio cholerae]HDG1636994.1 recombinase family protein [Vibrio cholerae]
MIVGYARVSTQDQSLELQLDALRVAGCEQVFSEKITGKSRERPELTTCLKMLRKEDVLVVWKLDRLARSLKDLVELINELESRQIGFRSLTEAIDTTTAGGRLVFHIFGALAEFEHNLIRERTIAGLAAARARGRKGGRKPSMSSADTRKAAAMLKDDKITKKEVAEHFGVSRLTLNKSLAREGFDGLPDRAGK